MLPTFTRRQFLQACAATAALAALPSAARSEAPAAKRPNFLFILTDDQRWDALGCVNPLVHTPTLDALAARGVRFADAFVATSICSPSRACCLTGRYGSANGVTAVDKKGQHWRKGEKTFAQMLKAAGYQTGFVGKWHIDRLTPQQAGFDSAVYFVSNGPWVDREVMTEAGPAVAKGFIEDYNAARAVAFLESAAKKDAPFVLHLCSQVPHMTQDMDWKPSAASLVLVDEAKMAVPGNYADDLTDKPPHLKTGRHRTQAATYGYASAEGIQRHRRQYLASVTDMDRSLGAVMAALDRLGLRETTWVIHMGDNGWFLGEHGFTSKVLPYEDSIRVPMIIAGPGTAGRVDNHFVMNADLAPTILDLAGLPVPANMHGRSLAPLLRSESPPWREAVYYEAPTADLGSWPLEAVRTKQWKYIRTFDLKDPSRTSFEELYDLAADGLEMKNLAADAGHKATLDGLRADAARLKKGLVP